MSSKLRPFMGKREQDEAAAEKIERRAAADEPDVRRARARPRRRGVNRVVERRRDRPVGYADRRIVVAVAELDAGGVVLELLRARPEDRRARLFPQRPSLLAVRFQERRERNLVIEAGAHRPGLAHVMHADRPALRLVAVEELGAAPALQHRGELPAQVHRVADAGVHAEAARRPQEVRRVAGEKDAPVPIALRDDAVAGPGPDGGDLERDVFPQRVAELSRRVERIDPVRLDAADVEAPELPAVDRGDRALNVGVDDLVLHRGAVAADR